MILQILLQFTCNNTSDMCPTLAAAHFSSALSSFSLLYGFVVGSLLSAIFQPAVVCVCVEAAPISPGVPLLETPYVVYTDV